MITAEDKKDLYDKAKMLAGTDEVFMRELLIFKSGLDTGIIIGKASAGRNAEGEIVK